MSTFPERLRLHLARNGRSLDPVELARVFSAHAGYTLTPQCFANWLNGVQKPQRGNLVALAGWLGTSPDALANSTPIIDSEVDKYGDIDIAQLVANYRQLDADKQRCAQAMLAGLLQLAADQAGRAKS